MKSESFLPCLLVAMQFLTLEASTIISFLCIIPEIFSASPRTGSIQKSSHPLRTILHLFSFNNAFLRHFPIGTCRADLFILMAAKNFNVWRYHKLFKHFLVDRHLNCFLFFLFFFFTNTAARSIFKPMSLNKHMCRTSMCLHNFGRCGLIGNGYVPL